MMLYLLNSWKMVTGEVGFHIADVTHYVKMDSLVEEEARQRSHVNISC